jgi:hypothetical protein
MNESDNVIHLDRITQSNAAHVLWVVGIEGGVQPGGFTEKLIEAMIVADTGWQDPSAPQGHSVAG